MESPNPPFDLTPKHVRAARALLAWSQQDLAKQANVATSTVADFERGHRTPMPNNAQPTGRFFVLDRERSGNILDLAMSRGTSGSANLAMKLRHSGGASQAQEISVPSAA